MNPMSDKETAVARVVPAVAPSTILRPIVTLAEVQAVTKQLRELIKSELREGEDYGAEPGIPKPFLHKPGAEKIAQWHNCAPEMEVVEKTVDHDRPLYRYVVRCSLVNRATGLVVGQGLGSASTIERKYASRAADLENTVLKMACKRALVAADLMTFALSGMFTQDEEAVQPDNGGAKPTPVDQKPITFADGEDASVSEWKGKTNLWIVLGDVFSLEFAKTNGFINSKNPKKWFMEWNHAVATRCRQLLDEKAKADELPAY
jgi:hypothetical protein